VPISKGQQVTKNQLSAGVDVEMGAVKKAFGTLAMATPIGKRAITLNIEGVGSLAGMLKPGDYVDVIAVIKIPVQMPGGKQVEQTANIPLFQNTLILAVGSQLVAPKTPEAEKAVPWDIKAMTKAPAKEVTEKASPLITLALSPQEANLLAFVSQQGQVRLLLRSPADAKVENLFPANWEYFFQYVASLYPAAAGQRKPGAEGAEKPAEKQKKQVEIYRGLKKDYLVVSE
jgi:Flp pilus assembly protein CpaB